MKTISIFNKIKLFFIRLKPSNLIHRIVKPFLNDLQKDYKWLVNEQNIIINNLDNKIKELRTRINSIEGLMPSELHEEFKTPFKDDEDVFVKRCAELQTELDEVIEENKELKKELKEYKHSYNMVLLDLKERVNKRINLTNERG